MDDLISRAAAIDAIVSATVFPDSDYIKNLCQNPANSEDWLDGVCDAINAVEDVNAVDAVPVVHGRWSEVAMDIVCSNCKAAYKSEVACLYEGEIDLQRFNGFEYCPHCGAKMGE